MSKQCTTQKHTWIGIDIGGTKTAVVLSSSPPVIAARVEFPTLPERGPAHALEQIIGTARRLLRENNVNLPQLGTIGVSCGGPLDRIKGIIQAPPNLSTWVDVPVKSILERELGFECSVENDANAGAVAEYRFGAGRGSRHMVFLTMGTGLGAGIIVDGRLYHGATDLAGEVGHVRLTPAGPVGHNKAGSVEGWTSGSGMAIIAIQEVKAAIRRGERSSLEAQLTIAGTLTAKDVGVAVAQGDRVAKNILDTTAVRLGETLAILVDVLNPDTIVIGGLAMRFGEDLLVPARAVMEREALAAAVKDCRVVPAELDEQIGDIAAICVAMGL
jgi:glucokinase